MNCGNLIYVFSEEDRDKLLKLGYKLISSGYKSQYKNAFVFADDPSMHMNFSINDIYHVKTNSMAF